VRHFWTFCPEITCKRNATDLVRDSNVPAFGERVQMVIRSVLSMLRFVSGPHCQQIQVMRGLR
jgi:hypothetical protein